MELAIGCSLQLITGVVATVLLNGLDPVLSRGFLLVQLAGQNGLGVAGLQDETELTVLALADLEPTAHDPLQ